MNQLRFFIKNTSYALLANVVSLFCSFIVTLVVPKVISIESNGYFNLYIFYLQYIGMFCLGWIDGIVLRYAGKDYFDLNKKLIKTEIIIFEIIQLLLGFGIILVTSVLSIDIYQKRVFILYGIAIIINMPLSFIRYLFQATNRIIDYSKNVLVERICYVLFILFFIVIYFRRFEAFIAADIIGKGISLFYIIFQAKDIFSIKGCIWRQAILDGIENIRCGFKLLVANLAGFFVIGSVRSVVNLHWGITIFAKLSLSLSISNLCITFIRAISIVIFPMLKRMDNNKLIKMYQSLKTILLVLLFGVLLSYYPVQSILKIWLPEYNESIVYLAILFPMCIYESKTALLLETYIKALREEAYLMYVNIITVLASGGLALFTAYVLNNVFLTVLMIVVAVAIRSILLERKVVKIIGINEKKSLILENVLVVLFVVFSWKIGGALGFICYLFSYIIYIILNKNNLKDVLKLKIVFVKNRK